MTLSRRRFLRHTAAASLAGLAPARAARPPKKSAPNLVFVFPDQMRGQALGFLGEEPVITPRLDQFASESLVLTETASSYPVCSPYRGMLMTGRWPHANGVISNCNSNTTPYACELKHDDRCWSDVLKDRGYSLGYIGKWHLDAPRKPYVKSYNNRPNFAWNEWCPPDRRHGFDFWHSYGTFDQHMNPEYWTTDMTRDERLKVNKWGPEHEADTAIQFLRNEDGRYRDPDRPFALVVSMNPPHTPYSQFPKRYLEAYADRSTEELCTRPNIPPPDSKWGKHYRANIRNYYAMITGVDDQFGRILDALKEQGLADNTIVVFTSDHGDCVGIHEHSTKNIYWEEAYRVPFLIRWPGHIQPRRDNLLMATPDIYPTLLDLMDGNRDIPAAVDGTSHAALFTTGKGPRPTSHPYIQIPYAHPELGRRGVRTHRHTYVVERVPGKPESKILFDRQQDPYQLENLAEKQPGLCRQLDRDHLQPWLDKMKEDPWDRTT